MASTYKGTAKWQFCPRNSGKTALHNWPDRLKLKGSSLSRLGGV